MTTALRSVSSPLTLVPAYGRRYNTSAEALRDWQAGLDFKVRGGSYTSIRDIEQLVQNSSSVWIQYFVDDAVRVA